MQEYRFAWHTWVGIILVALLAVTIFFPRISIDGTKYMEAALEANQYVYEIDSKNSAAKETLKQYEKESKEKDRTIKKLNQQLSNNISVRMSGFSFARWLLNVPSDMEFEGVEAKEDCYLLGNGVIFFLRLWGWLIYIPFLSSMILLIFMICKRRTYAPLVTTVGFLGILCELLAYIVIPSRIGEGISETLSQLPLVDSSLLEFHGTCGTFIRAFTHNSMTITWIFVLILSFVIFVYGILGMTVFCRKKEQKMAMEPAVNIAEGEAAAALEEFPISFIPNQNSKGQMMGMTGEYQGQCIEMMSGEEIILGRDPAHCMLIFQNMQIAPMQCGIRYDASSGFYYGVDYSGNGTYLVDGTILNSSQYIPIRPGTQLYLADGAEQFLLK